MTALQHEDTKDTKVRAFEPIPDETELKAVEKMNPVFEAQLLTYLRLSGLRVGLLINFTVPLIKNGIKRIVV